MNAFFRRLRYLVLRGRYERELADDLEFHREMAEREGRPFAHTLQLREESRDAWGWTWIDRFGQDLKYALRMLRRSPGFTLAAVAMLSIGIGVNVAVFGFFDLMYLRQMNVRDPNTLLRFHRRSPQAYAHALPVPEMQFFRDHSKTLSAVLGVNTARVSVEGEGQTVQGHFVTANLFTELGAGAVVGRTLLPGRDDARGAEPVVVLSYGFWQRHFGGDAGVVGTKLMVEGMPASIVGVAPASFSGLSLAAPAFWAALERQPYFAPGSTLLTDLSVESPGVQTYGRLAPGMNPRAAEDELGLLAGQLRRQYPKSIWEKESLPSQPGGYASTLREGNNRGTGAEDPDKMLPVFGLVVVLVGLILAVACANLGSLLLARGVAREREIAIRVAVGAGGGRLVRQLFTESLVLAVLGAAGGLGLGYVVLQYLMKATGAPSWMDASPDWRVAIFALSVGCGAAIIFGLVPALQVVRRRKGGTKMRQVLIAAQVAASCVLLIVSALLGRALDRAISGRPGFEYEKVIAVDAGLGRHGYTPAAARAYLDAYASRLRGMAGVEQVALTLAPPLGRVSITAGMEVDGHKAKVQLNRVTPEFLATMKIPLLRGVNLQAGDQHGVLVSDSLARTLWPGKDPLGQKFSVGDDFTVVGVTANARTVKVEDSDSVEAYLPLDAGNYPAAFVLVRTAGSPEDLARSAAVAAHSLDPAIFPEVELLKSGYRRKLEGTQTAALAVATMGAVAQLLACLGIFGVVAFAVSQRTREIGVRMALGARGCNVLRVVLRSLLVPVAIGLIAGVVAASALSKVMRGQLYGVSHTDPTTYAIALAIFGVTAALAALLPARRALRIDPWHALRHE